VVVRPLYNDPDPVSFIRRVFNADYRAAVAAEAAGNVDLAAERYGVAGDHEGAVRMHLARAQRAADRQAEIAALRDALRWAEGVGPLLKQASSALGRALLAKIEAEGIATNRDKERVREAAALLIDGGEHRLAGDALVKIGDHVAAANAFSAGGFVDRMEHALAEDDAVAQRVRTERDAFASYQTNMSIGRRDDARADLARGLEAAPNAGDYRRLLDELDTRLITAGRVELRRRGKPAIFLCAVNRIAVGRDTLCDLPLRTSGVSRRHAEIEIGGSPRYTLKDADSRNGTTLAGLPLAGRVPLVGTGSFGLGDDCRVDFAVLGEPGVLVLTVATGLDRGVIVIAAPEGEKLELAPAGVGVDVVFGAGRPFLGRGTAKTLEFNSAPLGQLRVQLIRGDRVVADGEELDVA
jgi:tetratricopeptide (TPR) repeat protein